jgi:hypothetical protein
VSRSFAIAPSVRRASQPRTRLAARLRLAAASRRERRLAAGVVAFAHVREEQNLLEGLARLVEAGEPLDAPLAASVERIAGERTTPPLSEGLAQLRALVRQAPAPGQPRVHPVAPLAPSMPPRRGSARRHRGFVALRVARMRLRSHADAVTGASDDGRGTTGPAPTQGSSR